MPPSLSPATLKALRQPRPYPAVSLLMPTHRRQPDNAQDPVRLRNLVAEADKQLRADPAVTQERRLDVLGQLDRALTQVDLNHAEDALAIFVAPGEHQVWLLGRTVPERVVLADTFLTRNVVAALAADRPFWVLTVSADHVALWDGHAERVREHRTDTFPLTRSLADPDAERKERVGDLPSTFQDEQTRRFLREADQAVRDVLSADPRPLYAVGEAAALSLLDSVGSVTKDAPRISHGGLRQGPAEAVLEAVSPLLAERAQSETADVLGELDKARGRRAFAAGLDEVWQSTTDARVHLLVVEEHYRETVSEHSDHLEPAEAADLHGRDDIVDEIVEQALEAGAQVHFVADGTLADMGRIACTLRY